MGCTGPTLPGAQVISMGTTYQLALLLPGLLIIVFTRRIVVYNARAYPRLYGRVGRVLALLTG